ncbi:hypothetical protein [Tuberibacillus sp. Marseille-P3662]|uniref:hypothetical protein n=1 Tax=Tuberibacillus sp. Marseille-P3662 TaxID=1965358 RepID=UPI000A1CCF97|nr:hypothetical protein [Tuberibacillus sp. Marseille-P3662]
MNKKYSICSVALVVIGLFIVIEPLSPLDLWSATSLSDFLSAIFAGMGIYIIGVILGVVAFARREKGFLKYVSVVSVIIGIFFVGIVN